MEQKNILLQTNKTIEEMTTEQLLLNFFINNVDSRFCGQMAILKNLNTFYKRECVRKQPAISKALKKMMDRVFQIKNDRYQLVNHNGWYKFKKIDDTNKELIYELVKKHYSISVTVYEIDTNIIAYKTSTEYVPALKTCLDNLYYQGEIFDVISNNNNLYVVLTPNHKKFVETKKTLNAFQMYIENARKEIDKE